MPPASLKNIPSSRHSAIYAHHIIFSYQRYVSLASEDFYLSTFKTTNLLRRWRYYVNYVIERFFLCQQQAFVA